MIIFKKIDSIDPVVAYLADVLKAAIAEKKRTVWFVPGGSVMAIVLQVAKQLEHIDLRSLAVTLTDERYGEVGHNDSNWQQLKAAGLSLPDAVLLPVLVGQDRQSTTDRYDELLRTLFAEADYTLGLFGIGPDGHTAGILPGSPALDSEAFAATYDALPYERITMTPRAITQFSEAVVYAVGEPKRHVIEELEADVPVRSQPAQVLKQVPRLTVFNDFKDKV